jgi:ABC-type protease/lipase transport system fused ATPase/permease subunit
LADKLVVIKEGTLLLYDERDKVLEALSKQKAVPVTKKQ